MKTNKKLKILTISMLLLIFGVKCTRENEKKVWNDSQPIWSPNGQYITFNRIYRLMIPYNPPDTLWQDTLSGLRILDLASLKVIDSLISTFCVDWSSNGDEILCTGGRVYNVKTHIVRAIFDTSWHYYVQDWSPNGTRMLCVKKNLSPDSFMILMVDTLGTYSKILFNSGLGPSWHPSGGRIVFIGTFNNKIGICIGDTNGNIIRSINVANGDLTPYAVVGPRFSPDGSKIVYYLYQYQDGGLDDYKIHICDSLGNNDIELIDGIHPCWSPDGMKIVFARYSKEDSLFSLWSINANGTNLRKITE